MSKRIASSVLVVGILVLMTANVANATIYTGLGIEGRLMLPGGINPVVSATTEFKLQVRSPGTEDCLLWEEIQIKDLSISSGNFAVSLNDNPANRTDGGPYGIEKAFANSGSLTFAGGRCSVGTVYTPGPNDQRKLVIMFRETSAAPWETFGPQQLDHAPMAIEAKQVGGFNSGSLLRVVEADGITPRISSLSPLSNAQYVELMAVISGSTTQYERAGKINGGVAPTMISGQVLGWNGLAWTSVASGGGTVTSITAGTGLSGGAITSSGTIGIAAGGVGSLELAAGAVTSAKIATGAVTGTSLATSAVSLSNIASSAYSSSNFASTLVQRDPSSNIVATNATVDGLKLNNAGSIVTVQNPVGAMYTLILPNGTGANGQVLTTNGSGVTSWATVLTASTGLINGGNSFGANASLGTNDAFAVDFKTVNLTRMTIAPSGNVGVGITTPGYKLDVAGDLNLIPGSAFRINGTQICWSAGCTAVSDRRLKKNIVALENSYESVQKLLGVSYDWKQPEIYGHSRQIGFIAQDLEKVYPQAVVSDQKSGLKTVAYDHLVAPLVEAFKTLVERFNHLSKRVDSHDRDIASVKEENTKLKQENAAMKERLDNIEKKLDSK